VLVLSTLKFKRKTSANYAASKYTRSAEQGATRGSEYGGSTLVDAGALAESTMQTLSSEVQT
jgi:hypothetical protein